MHAPGLAARLGIGFGLVLAMVFALVAVGLVQERRIARAEERLSAEIAPRTDAANRLERAFFRRVVAFRAYLVVRDDRHRRDAEAARSDGEAALRTLRELPAGGTDGPLVAELAPLLAAYDARLDEALARVDAGVSPGELGALDQELVDLRTRLTGLTGTLVDRADREVELGFAELRRTQAWASRASLALGVAVLLIGILAAAWVIRPVRRQAADLAGAARALAAGDHGPARVLLAGRRGKDELDEVARSFGRMSVELEARERRLAAQARLSRALASSHDVARLATDAVGVIAEHVGCESGAIYLFDRSRCRLARVGGVAADGSVPELAAGEGLPGQAAASGRIAIVRDLPADGPFRLRVGLGDLPARTVAALPIGEGEPVGALVLAAVRDLPDEAFSFAAEACRQLAVSLESALAAAEVARLAGALGASNEELEERNAELQAQTEEIQAQNEELQAQAEEIVAQNEELQRQQAELLAADQIKDEFLSVASHEFKSPIAALKSFCQLLVRKVRGRTEYAELLPMLERIDAQADKVVLRINRLLDVSRAKLGTLAPAPERLDLVALVRGLVGQAQVRTDRHRLVFESTVDHLAGRWDRLYLEQAIGNLLDNGIRYSPGGGDIHVELREQDGEAHLAIRDGGIGIAPEVQDRLFQPYFRGEAARRVAADGMGIGLFVTKELVALHGGRISVESRPGEGSTFRIALPLAPPLPAATSAA